MNPNPPIRLEGPTLRAAMQTAQRRYGRDVLVLGSEQTPTGYAITLQLPDSRAARDQSPSSSQASQITIPRPDARSSAWSPGFDELADRALTQGYPRSVVEAVQYALRNTRVRLDRRGDPALPRVATQILSALIPTISLDSHRRLAVVGPTGVGKTTTIAKLAALAARRGESVAILTLDTYRVAAVEQMRAYADLLDVPCEVAFTPSDLLRLLDRYRDRDRVFVDTTGRSPFDRSALDRSRAVLGRVGLETLICINATARRADAERILDAFGDPKPGAVVLTKWDETEAPGEALGTAIERSLPLCHITIGQEVPDDIVPADARSLAARAFGVDLPTREGVSS